MVGEVKYAYAHSELTRTERIISVNGRLSEWRTFDESRGSRMGKNTENLARAIVAQLTHQEAVACLVADWRKFGSDLRTQITSLCNREREQASSGNKSKMIKRLDELLGGNVLRTADELDSRMTDAAGRKYHSAHAMAQLKYAGHIPQKRRK